ncbi:MAG TPA: cation:proton antiporter [Gemmatimonadota bacterium]|nr:cation:proton antiporter [Gemmatimonadota bacterium]
MEDLALLLAAAAAGHALAHRSRLPAVPCLLVAGVALSLIRPPSRTALEETLALGVALLVFIAGLELDIRRLGAQRRAALRVGILQFAAVGTCGLAAASLLGFGPAEAAYVALALAASSTLVCVRLLQRRQQLFEPFGRLVIGVLLLQDALVVLLVPFAPALGGAWTDATAPAAAVAALGLAGLGVRRWLAPLFLRVADEEELLVLGALAVLFAFMGAGAALRLPLVVGAFVAGVSLSPFPVEEVVRVELSPIGDFFTAVFFVALGAVIGVPTPDEALRAGALAIVVLLATPLLVTVLAERSGFSARSAIEAGLMLSQASEISLVVGLSGVWAGRLSDSTFTVLAMVTGGTMLVTPFLASDRVARGLTRLHPARWMRPPAVAAAGGHVVLIGCGSTGSRLVDLLLTQGREALVVDEDPAVLAALRETGVAAVRGDASDPAVLSRAGVDRASVIVSTVHRPRRNEALLREVGGRVPVLVRVFDEEEARWVEARGGRPIVTSEAAAAAFLAWYEGTVRALPRAREDERGGSGTPG